MSLTQFMPLRRNPAQKPDAQQPEQFVRVSPEVLDLLQSINRRATRIETRLVKCMEALNLDADGNPLDN